MEWKCSYSAVPGRGHDQADFTTCEDVVAGISNESVTCICLADGAGSAKFARLGASEVVQATIHLFSEKFDELFKEDDSTIGKIIIDNCLTSIKKTYGESEDFDIKDYSATLLVVAIQGDNCICAHVGDGIIGKKDDQGLEIVSFPWNGEFVNVTVFVTSKDASSIIDIQKFKLKKEIGFFVMSDGAQKSFYCKKALINVSVLNYYFEFASSNSTEDTSFFLENNLLNVISKIPQTTDDCSFGMIVKD